MSEKKNFKVHCSHCKDQEGKIFEFDFIKDKEILKEFKEYIKDAEKKYNNPNVVAREYYNACPQCGKNIRVRCKDYIDFYTPKKKIIEETSKELIEDIKKTAINNIEK